MPLCIAPLARSRHSSWSALALFATLLAVGPRTVAAASDPVAPQQSAALPPGTAAAASSPAFPSADAPVSTEAPLPPDEVERRANAEKLFRSGVSLQKLEDFDAAVEAYRSSLELFATKSALFNLANCLRVLHRYGEALEHFRQLQSNYGPTLTSAMAEATQRQVSELEGLVGELRLTLHPSGAQLWVDGQPVAYTRPLLLTLGAHEVRVQADGYEPATVTVRVQPRTSVSHTVQLRSTGTAATTPSPGAKPSVPEGTTTAFPWQPVGWGLVGTGALLGVVGSITGWQALSLDRELSADCQAGHCPSDDADKIEQMEELAQLSTLSWVGAVAFAGAGTFVLVTLPPSEQSQTQPTLGPSARRTRETFAYWQGALP